MGIWLGNAPVSWAVFEAGGRHPPFSAVLDAIAQAGYAGTELGPYGYLPTHPGVLAEELASRKLRLASSYLALPIDDPARREASIATALQVAGLLAGMDVQELIIADDEDAQRAQIAGRVSSARSPHWDNRAWAEVRRTLAALSRALRNAFGMRIVVHPHAGTFIETPAEIERLLAESTPGEVDLLLDTGHCVYGGGDPVELLRAHGDRVRYVHLKDVRPDELERVRHSDINMHEAFARGVFCSPGSGTVRFGEIIAGLRRQAYQGWAIVEQDIVPDDIGRLVPEPFESARNSREYLRREFDL